MAEPVRKCSRCRLRVQGMRQHGDGQSYCGRCLAQVESLEQIQQHERGDEARERAPDDSPQAAPAGGLRAMTKSAMEQPPVEEGGQPPAAPAAQQSAQPDEPAGAEQPTAAARRSGRERAITGSEGGNALVQALRREHELLQQQGRDLVAELHRIEGDIAAVDDRLDHVTALLEPDGEAGEGRTEAA